MSKILFGILVAFISVSVFTTRTFAEDDHVHGASEGHSEDHKDKGAHEEGDAHDDHDEEHSDDGEHEEEGGAKVGPDKGIIEKGEYGFKLSKEATAAFELKVQNFIEGEVEFPKSAIVYIKNGQYLYRKREEWIKRIPVKAVKTANNMVRVVSSDLKNGDQIITSGSGYIRGAELILSEGATHSH